MKEDTAFKKRPADFPRGVFFIGGVIVSKQKTTDSKKLVVLALVCALAYVSVVFFRIPVVMFLDYEPKDCILAIAGMVYGPLSALAVVVADGHYIAQDQDIDSRELRAPLQEFGLLPIVQINIKELFELVHSGAKCLRLKLAISKGPELA